MWGLSTKQSGFASLLPKFLAVGLGRGGSPTWWGSVGLAGARVGPGVGPGVGSARRMVITRGM